MILSGNKKFPFDLQIINKYLMFWQELIEALMISTVDITDILTSISNNLRYENSQKDTILFKYGDKAQKFYLILKGKIAVMLPREVIVCLTEEEYFIYLNNLRKYEEFALINKTITKQNNYPIKDIEYEYWLRNHTVNYKKRFEQKNSTKKSDIISKYKVLSEFHEENVNFATTKEYVDRIKPIINIKSDSKRKEVIIYEYYLIINRQSGDKFGDYAFGTESQKRTASIIIVDDCHFGTLEKRYFEAFLKEANDKKRRLYVSFLISTNVFQSFDRLIFQKKYFNLFIEERINKRGILFKEGDQFNYIYFIKSGEVELYLRISLGKLKKIIRAMGAKPYNPKIILENSAFKKFLKQTTLIKVNICKDGDILGLEDICIKDKYIYTAECYSSKCILLKVNTEIYNNIIQTNETAQRNVKNFNEFKIGIMAERLNIILETLCKFFFKKENSENCIDTKIKTVHSNNFFSSIKSLQNFNQVKNSNSSISLLTKKEVRMNGLNKLLTESKTPLKSYNGNSYNSNLNTFKKNVSTSKSTGKLLSPSNKENALSHDDSDKIQIETVINNNMKSFTVEKFKMKLTNNDEIVKITDHNSKGKIEFGSDAYFKKIANSNHVFPRRKVIIKKDKIIDFQPTLTNIKFHHFRTTHNKLKLDECIKIDKVAGCYSPAQNIK